MVDVEVIDDPAAATVALDPVRSRLLSELSQPASAAALAARLGLARQKVNYHLRALEAHELVTVAETRQWGGLTERLLVASAASYVVSPSALGPVAASPSRDPGALSASYLIALAARIIGEVSMLLRRSRAANKRLATLSLDTEIRFRSAAERAAFSSDLTSAIATLVARYHDRSAPGGRLHRVVVMAHPLAVRGGSRCRRKRGQSPFPPAKKNRENGDCPAFPPPEGHGLQQPAHFHHGLLAQEPHIKGHDACQNRCVRTPIRVGGS